MKRRTLIVVLFCITVLGLVSPLLRAQADRREIIVLNVRDVIDFAQAAYTERVIREAIQNGNDRIVLAIDTPGGALDATIRIVKAIFDNDKQIEFIAFVEHSAFSAGSLIALACNKVYMKPGTIGATLPVTVGKEGMKSAGEKVISAVRAEFRSISQKRGRNSKIVEAMVDPSVEIYELPGENGGPPQILTLEEKEKMGDKAKDAKIICGKGKILTLTHVEALKYGLIDKVLESKLELAEELGVPVDFLRENKLTWSEKLVRFLNNPIVSGLLLMVGMMGLYMEFKIPGFGLPGIVGVVCLGLLLGSKMFVGLAGWLEVLLILLGLVLIALEIFVFPGFGIAGISGIIMLASGIVLAFIPIMSEGFKWQPWSFVRLQTGMLVFVCGMAGSLLAFAVVVKYLPKIPAMKGIILEAEEDSQAGYVSTKAAKYPVEVGSRGVALTKLRPAGTAEFEGKRIDVVTQGDFIEAGSQVEVCKIEGARIVVMKRDSDA